MMSSSRVARVIIAYAEDTVEDAARSIPDGSLDTNFVVNNGPVSWSLSPTSTAKSNPTVVEYQDNPGYLPAVERLLRSGNLDHIDWVIISNSDIETIHGFIPPNVGTEVAVIGPKFTARSKYWNPRQPQLARQIALTMSAVIRYAITVAAPKFITPRRIPSPTARPTSDSIMVHGSCFAIRRNVLEHFFDSSKPSRLFGEEVLLGWYLSDTGHEFLIDSTWVVQHHGAASMSLPSVRRIADRERLRSRSRILWMLISRKRAHRRRMT